MKITLRKRKLKDGKESLYLDYYEHYKHRAEFLGLYLIPEKTRGDKETNARTIAVANNMLAKEEKKIMLSKIGINEESEVTIADFLREQSQRKESKSSRYVLIKCEESVRQYRNEKLKDCDRRWAQGLVDFLKGNKTTYIVSYYANIIKSAFKNAMQRGMIEKNPFDYIDPKQYKRPKTEERSYLTFDEYTNLMKQEWNKETSRQVFGFSCWTGLRISDIINLKWGDIKDGEIKIKMQKTKKTVCIPIVENARKFLPEKSQDEKKVFNIKSNDEIYYSIMKATKAAGINKKVSIHTARHTFATLLLSSGVSLEAVKELLGHTDIKITQIYAKLLETTKKNAMEQLQNSYKI